MDFSLRLRGFPDDRRHVETCQLAGTLADDPVDDDGIDVCRFAVLDELIGEVGVVFAAGSMFGASVRTRMTSARLPGLSDPT